MLCPIMSGPDVVCHGCIDLATVAAVLHRQLQSYGSSNRIVPPLPVCSAECKARFASSHRSRGINPALAVRVVGS